MQIDLPVTTRPWQINVPPPRDRLFEVTYKGTTIICGYEEREENWVIGCGKRLQRDEIHRWRELSRLQIERILNLLSQKS